MIPWQPQSSRRKVPNLSIAKEEKKKKLDITSHGAGPALNTLGKVLVSQPKPRESRGTVAT
jgi:hypothetical protein